MVKIRLYKVCEGRRKIMSFGNATLYEGVNTNRARWPRERSMVSRGHHVRTDGARPRQAPRQALRWIRRWVGVSRADRVPWLCPSLSSPLSNRKGVNMRAHRRRVRGGGGGKGICLRRYRSAPRLRGRPEATEKESTSPGGVCGERGRERTRGLPRVVDRPVGAPRTALAPSPTLFS